MTEADMRILVTLITGFLGAGKTTLLNHLLRSPEAGRVAVIINEFGDIGLDHDLIESATEEMVLMQSGCLCCSIRGDLVTSMADLAQRRANGLIAFERVVIETTGRADPAHADVGPRADHTVPAGRHSDASLCHHRHDRAGPAIRGGQPDCRGGPSRGQQGRSGGCQCVGRV